MITWMLAMFPPRWFSIRLLAAGAREHDGAEPTSPALPSPSHTSTTSGWGSCRERRRTRAGLLFVAGVAAAAAMAIDRRRIGVTDGPTSEGTPW